MSGIILNTVLNTLIKSGRAMIVLSKLSKTYKFAT